MGIPASSKYCTHWHHLVVSSSMALLLLLLLSLSMSEGMVAKCKGSNPVASGKFNLTCCSNSCFIVDTSQFIVLRWNRISIQTTTNGMDDLMIHDPDCSRRLGLAVTISSSAKKYASSLLFSLARETKKLALLFSTSGPNMIRNPYGFLVTAMAPVAQFSRNYSSVPPLQKYR
jgi:hypothetical protein